MCLSGPCAATFLGAWRYPDQTSVWRVVHVDKLGAWALLVSLSFVLVASIKSQEGTALPCPGRGAAQSGKGG